ncbi:class I SAM-dependent methyltransferase [Defluviimonas sp. WL0002]|uniref:Class I SAM-dependent methyltransferase n=1 Tax=Albidovulum marisflavi TaxID=2984159 RepID=A0ABT2ZHI4_9RHOB|nr:class I SAM-dependent methyltransferase [Defluviimonas sp. WL0002]MCV2870589.1 class I SAM-dependent methyltransferase [Defluviimonas sp. WL0002]
MKRDPAEFTGAPWRGLENQIPPRARTVPTMLRDEEQALYYWLGRDWAKGKGAVVDLGCFVGGSTARFAAGITEAQRNTQVHAFDRFTANEQTKERTLYPQGIRAFEGTDVLDLAQSLLTPWVENVTLHPGDILRARWNADPIEVLAVDAAKTARSADRIAAEFFPALIPGASVIVQQDLLHWKQPWLIAQMHALADAATPVAFCARDCAVFLVTGKIGPQQVEAAQTALLDDRELVEVLESAAASAAFAPVARRIGKAIDAVKANPGERRAWALSKEAAG